jgi:cytochrome b
MNTDKQTMVWDLFVRIFHWLLVVFFFLAYATGDGKGPLHRYIGTLVLLLVMARIYWGFFGSKYALFKNFMCAPRKAIAYVKTLCTGTPPHYTGHNPAAAWMILFLLTGSLILGASGFLSCTNKGGQAWLDLGRTFSLTGTAYADPSGKKLHGDRYTSRKHAAKEEDEVESFWGEFHETAATLMLSLACLHIIGVLLSSRMHHENLTKSMITGYKAEQATKEL